MSKAFISYSWSSPAHREAVREWADRLQGDGVEVLIDVYDLKEGDDKYAFMERMITDESVKHVLVFSDRGYADKADRRERGVGTESQIISREIYEKTQQSKFVPIVCETTEEGEPYLPAFLKARIWIDFSNLEKVNENWEKLIRLLHGKPLFQKPPLGNPPAYIGEGVNEPLTPASIKFALLKQAVMQDRKSAVIYRREFLTALKGYVDSFRVRKTPDISKLGEKVLADCGKLALARDLVIDWVFLEVDASNRDQFVDELIALLEKVLQFREKPDELEAFNDLWFEAHKVFAYEVFLYLVAGLLKLGAVEVLHEVFHAKYLRSDSEWNSNRQFQGFSGFYGYSETLQTVLAPPGQRLLSAAAELIKRQATRSDIPFRSLMEAELLVLLMAFIDEEARWYPQTLYYSGGGAIFPLFTRAARHKDFLKLSKITGESDASNLRKRVKAGMERLDVGRWHNNYLMGSISVAMNLDQRCPILELTGWHRVGAGGPQRALPRVFRAVPLGASG